MVVGERKKMYDNVTSREITLALITYHMNCALALTRRLHHRRSLFNPGSSSTLRGVFFFASFFLLKITEMIQSLLDYYSFVFPTFFEWFYMQFGQAISRSGGGHFFGGQ